MNEQVNTQIIVVAGRKGGLTKSTVAINLAAALAENHAKRVIVVESDGQGSASRMAGLQPQDAFYNLIVNDADWADVLVRVPERFSAGEMYLLSSSDAQISLENDPWVGNSIYQRFQELRGWADYVIIDTSPAINEINSSFFYTAGWILLPTLCGKPEIDMLQTKTMAYIEQAQEAGRQSGFPAARIMGIIPNRYDTQTNVDRVWVAFMKQRFGEICPVFDLVRNSSGWKTAAHEKMSIYSLKRLGDSPNDRRQARLAIAEFNAVVQSALNLTVEAVR